MTHFYVQSVPVLIQQSRDIPLIWFDVTLHGGAALDPLGQEGLHRHAALWARRGAGARNRQQLDEYLDTLGASLEVSVGRDTITLSGLALTRNIEGVITAAADVLTRPRFDSDEYDRLLRETPQLIDEVRDDDGALATRWFDWTCCPGHPYGRTALGTEASVANTNASAARAVWQALVSTGNMVIGFAGDIGPERAQLLAAELLASVGSGSKIALPADTFTRTIGPRTTIVDKPARTQAQIRMGHLVPAYQPQVAAPIAIIESALGGMFTSRLMQEIRVKRGWSYGAGCGFRRSKLSHWFEVWMATGLEVAVDAALLTRDILADFASNGPSEEEIDLARAYLVGTLPFQRATARQRMQLAVRDELMGLPVNFAEQMSAAIAQTSTAEVKRACADYIAPNDLVCVMVTTLEGITPHPNLGVLTNAQASDY
jgi:zinc protease